MTPPSGLPSQAAPFFLRPRRRSTLAYSLPELILTISIIGILAAVGIQTYSGIHRAARENAARENLSLLNRGLLHFAQVNWDIQLTPVSGAASDELAILRTLQWRNPAGESPGSPYIPANFNDTASSSSDDYRIQWNGSAFELLAPETPGTGLLTGQSSPGGGGTPTYPEDYEPIGPEQNE